MKEILKWAPVINLVTLAILCISVTWMLFRVMRLINGLYRWLNAVDQRVKELDITIAETRWEVQNLDREK